MSPRVIWILLRWPVRKWLHRRCLRRIAALERALGLQVDERMVRLEAMRIEPGAIWRVQDALDVHLCRPYGLELRSVLKQEWLEESAA